MNAGATRRRAAFVAACRLDVEVRKPGNVSVVSPGHGMRARQFIDSASAAAAPLCRTGARLGRRIEEAVDASWAAAGCNTNLGIVLLAAPIAAAAERPGALVDLASLRHALAVVLGLLDLDDAAAAFRAIAKANPGGLGDAGAHDVRRAPRVALVDAMREAAPRDRIAQQYAEGFREVFDAARGLGFARMLATGDAARDDAVLRVYLGFLASRCDSHIVRKHGAAVAQNVMSAAQGWQAHPAPSADPALAVWDESLKAAAVNPGTSADLTVATLFVAALLDAGWHGT
jgi:triphosphoribosyl-dephospho-CoA synthase